MNYCIINYMNKTAIEIRVGFHEDHEAVIKYCKKYLGHLLRMDIYGRWNLDIGLGYNSVNEATLNGYTLWSVK